MTEYYNKSQEKVCKEMKSASDREKSALDKEGEAVKRSTKRKAIN